MEKKESPKETGISRITGKIVKVRHATEADMGFIVENLEKYHLDTEDAITASLWLPWKTVIKWFWKVKRQERCMRLAALLLLRRKKSGIDSLIIKI
jgi:hypothetical protein